MKRLFIILILFAVYTGLYAQNPYEPYIAQYMTEGLSINPAFAGHREVLSASMIVRNNITGADWLPSYQTANIHTPLTNTKIGIGVSLSHISPDPISDNYDLSFSYAYRTDFIGGKLALGIKAGVESESVKYSNVKPFSSGDMVFQENYSTTRFNAGIGFQYYSDNFYIGGSIPKLIIDNDTSDFSIFDYNYFLNSGFNFKFDNFQIGPTVLVNLNPGTKLTYIGGVYANWWRTYVTLGYMNYGAILTNAQFKISEQVHLGLAYEFGINETTSLVANTIEILLRYELRYLVRSVNPLDF